MLKSSAAQGDKDGIRVILCMLSFPILVVTMWCASPSNFHWYHTRYCILFGIGAWVGFSVCGLSGQMKPWHAVLLILEAGFGLVPVAYLLFDFGRVGEDCHERMHQSRVLASVPVVIMAKQLGRTVVDMQSVNTPSVWWHFYVDLSEILLYLCFGLWTTLNMGERWFLIYTTAPVIVSSLWADHIVLRLHALLRENARLMQAAFAAVVRVDGLKCGRVLETTSEFDLLVDGDATGCELSTLFRAGPNHFEQLFSPAPDGERVVRRLKTVLVSKSRSFQQDIELRVFSAAEHELQKERGLLLGVAIMGERLPISESLNSCSSTLMEQYLDEVGQLRIAGIKSADVAVPEMSEVDCFDSVSMPSTLKRRRRRARSVSSSSTSSGSSLPPIRAHTLKTASSTAASTPHGCPWEATTNNPYLKEVSLSNLEDLLSSWNDMSSQCCHWHAACNHLSQLAEELKSWYSCNDAWPTEIPSWQCDTCRAVIMEQGQEECWLCFAPRPDELPS